MAAKYAKASRILHVTQGSQKGGSGIMVRGIVKPKPIVVQVEDSPAFDDHERSYAKNLYKNVQEAKDKGWGNYQALMRTLKKARGVVLGEEEEQPPDPVAFGLNEKSYAPAKQQAANLAPLEDASDLLLSEVIALAQQHLSFNLRDALNDYIDLAAIQLSLHPQYELIPYAEHALFATPEAWGPATRKFAKLAQQAIMQALRNSVQLAPKEKEEFNLNQSWLAFLKLFFSADSLQASEEPPPQASKLAVFLKQLLAYKQGDKRLATVYSAKTLKETLNIPEEVLTKFAQGTLEDFCKGIVNYWYKSQKTWDGVSNIEKVVTVLWERSSIQFGNRKTMKNTLKSYLAQLFGVKIRLEDPVRDIAVSDLFASEDDFRNFLERELGRDKLELFAAADDVDDFAKDIFDQLKLKYPKIQVLKGQQPSVYLAAAIYTVLDKVPKRPNLVKEAISKGQRNLRYEAVKQLHWYGILNNDQLRQDHRQNKSAQTKTINALRAGGVIDNANKLLDPVKWWFKLKSVAHDPAFYNIGQQKVKSDRATFKEIQMGNLEKFYNLLYKEGFDVQLPPYVTSALRSGGELRRKRTLFKQVGNVLGLDPLGERNDKIMEIAKGLEKYIVISEDYIYPDPNIDDKARFELFRKLQLANLLDNKMRFGDIPNPQWKLKDPYGDWVKRKKPTEAQTEEEQTPLDRGFELLNFENLYERKKRKRKAVKLHKSKIPKRYEEEK